MPMDETVRPVAFDFLFNPLCGWCYGAAPTIAAIRAAFPVPFPLYPIGLFVKEKTSAVA